MTRLIALLMMVFSCYAQPVSGWTARFLASTNANLYDTLGPPYSGLANNGQNVWVWENTLQPTTNLVWLGGAGGNGDLYTTSGISGLGSLIVNSLSWYSLNLASEAAAQPWSTLITNTAFTIYAAFEVTGNCSNASPQYENSALLGDSAGGYVAISCITNTGITTINGQGYDTSFRYTANQVITQNVPHVVMIRHDSGNLVLSIDCGSESSTAYGNTGTLTSIPYILRNYSSSNYWPGEIGEVIFYNTALNSSDRSTTCTYMHNTWSNAASSSAIHHKVTSQ
jgi:hypothetical protein